MKDCQAFDTCTRPALFEVRGYPDEGAVTLMCPYHAEPFFDDRLTSLFHPYDGIEAEELQPA